MNVIVAETAGFCFGVRRAVDTVYEQTERKRVVRPIYTCGPIIHNEEVVRDLESRGVSVLDEEEIEAASGGTVIIRSHGVGRRTCERLEEQGFQIVDATCPFVKKIHRIVQEESAKGRTIVIIGNAAHPEVKGIRGWCPERAYVVETPEEASELTLLAGTKLCIVSQTTFNYNKFQLLVEIILKKSYDSIVVNTICSATHERQAEARQLASKVDVMLVIGGKHSSNTQKLYEICRRECNSTYHIQTVRDLDPRWLEGKRSVGITAGASTPNHIIEEVHTNVRIKF
ncbi:MAG: 4-hydroxy-3-methylbut-2-enyl diphosphate reductase [Lachnospiraceae bacterium]|nr:4-hydroxy-3-methylbut-2-enyl diphosphate reductase [Lachnospiraceae bacterium]